MHLALQLILPFIIFKFSTSIRVEDILSNIKDEKWQCDTVCAGSGGDANFDEETKTCKCVLDRNADDKDLEVMLKNARTLGLLLDTYNTFQHLEKITNRTIQKREVDTSATSQTVEVSEKVNVTETSNHEKTSEGIVGQQLPARNRPNRRRPLQLPTRQARPNQATQIQTRGGSGIRPRNSLTQAQRARLMEDIRTRMRHMNENSATSKSRAADMAAIRENLRKLSQSPHLQQRANSATNADLSGRIRELREQLRKRQEEIRRAANQNRHVGPRVGSSSAADRMHRLNLTSRTNTAENSTSQSETKVITQPANLVEDDQDES